jgi:HAMP domain-containing protein
MECTGRKGRSLTYKFVIIILILTLVPAFLMVFSSLSTFNEIEGTIESAMTDIKVTAMDQTTNTKTTAIKRTKATILDVLKTDLKRTREDKIDKYSQTLTAVQLEANTTADYIERAWLHLDGGHFDPVFSGGVWAGPLNNGTKRASYRDQVNKLSHVGVFLEHMDRGNQHTSLTYFGTRDNNVVTSRNITGTLEQIPSGFSNVERPWYIGARDAGETVWTNTYVDANTNELVTTVASPVYQDERLLGVVGFDVTLGVLTNDILETDPGFAFLLDSSGEAIVYPGMSAPNKTVYAQRTFNGTNFLEDNVSDELRELAANMVAGRKGLTTVTIEGKESYVAYGPLEASDWSVGVAVPVEETVKPVDAIEQDLRYQLDTLNKNIDDKTSLVQTKLDSAIRTTIYRYFLLFLLIIMIIASLGVYVSRKITQPIIRLHEKAESISKGGIEKEVAVDTGDEIEELADSFNRIMRTIKILQQRDAPSHNIDTGGEQSTDDSDTAADDADTETDTTTADHVQTAKEITENADERGITSDTASSDDNEPDTDEPQEDHR